MIGARRRAIIVTNMKHLPAALLLALFAAGPTARAGDLAHLLPPPQEEWLEVAELVLQVNREAAAQGDPLRAPMILCEERGCSATGTQSLGEEEAARLRALFAEDDGPDGERRRLGRAIALLETITGARNGTWRDHAANEHESEDEPGQLDCIAESINTRSYLDRLNAAGLIRHHQLGGFIQRYTLVLQHVALDIIENGSDERFAVDSWVGANGEEPEITPYGDWRWEWGV